MRVAFDPSSMLGAKTGIGVYTESLIRALEQFAPEVAIFKLDDGVSANQRTDLRIWREQIILPCLAQTANTDLLHLTGFATPLRASRPVVLTVHDLIGALFAAHFPPVARFYWSRYLPFTLRFAAHIIADSENTKRDILRLSKIPPDRIRVIYPGRDEKFSPIRAASMLEETRRVLELPLNFLLFVSTLEPRKGVDTLISAFARVANRISDDLVIVGKPGWGCRDLSVLVEREGLTSRVHFLNYVPDGQMPALYNLAHALVFPSRYEGFGLPALEAMACGTPVICSSTSSLPEVVGNAALLVSPDDVDGLAKAIVGLIGDANRQNELRARGLVQSQKFSWERAVKETLTVYHQVLGV